METERLKVSESGLSQLPGDGTGQAFGNVYGNMNGRGKAVKNEAMTNSSIKVYARRAFLYNKGGWSVWIPFY